MAIKLWHRSADTGKIRRSGNHKIQKRAHADGCCCSCCIHQPAYDPFASGLTDGTSRLCNVFAGDSYPSQVMVSFAGVTTCDRICVNYGDEDNPSSVDFDLPNLNAMTFCLSFLQNFPGIIPGADYYAEFGSLNAYPSSDCTGEAFPVTWAVGMQPGNSLGTATLEVSALLFSTKFALFRSTITCFRCNSQHVFPNTPQPPCPPDWYVLDKPRIDAGFGGCGIVTPCDVCP